MTVKWDVRFSKKAGKQYKNLKMCGTKPSINDILDLLVFELKSNGSERTNWLNYGKLSENTFHCHLKKGKPTYVACWAVLDYKLKRIEVYYAGTHEGTAQLY